MKVTGEAELRAPVERVWDALFDPEVLVRTIPGCQRLEVTGPDEYRMTVTAGVAAIKGSYLGTVRLTDQHRPASFVLRAAGSGAPGTVQVDVTVTLSPEDGGGATRLAYDADAVVGGPVGGVGQRMLTGVARKTAGEFFRAVDEVLSEQPGPPATEPVPAGSATSPTSPAAPAPAAFNRPTAASTPPPIQPLLLAGAAGAAIALFGVAVGARLARRR